MAYRHTQRGWMIGIACGLGAVTFLVMAATQPFPNQVERTMFVLGAALMAGIGLLWSRMTIEVRGDRLRWSFGLGWPRFSLRLAEIRSIDVTRTTFWQGWGIHLTGQGWLYNVSGSDAVLIVRNDGKKLLLGTDEPRRLKAAVERALPPRERTRA